jgi:hypothetical protein
VKTFFFSFFSLLSAFTWLSKSSSCFLWRNNASIHFLYVVSQISAFSLKSCNSSSYDFSHDVPLELLILILWFFNEHFNLLFNICPILPRNFHIMFIPLLELFLLNPIPLVTLPSASPL